MTPPPSAAPLFLAPPATAQAGSDVASADEVDDANPQPGPSSWTGSRVTRGRQFTRGARGALAQLSVSEADVEAVLETATDVRPEGDKRGRNRFTGNGLSVVTGDDGAVLAVYRRRR
jgi:hypothetical protein